MPLPFSNQHDGKRQFSCFCCGVLQPDKPSFIEHVRTNHEEGKEYIVCPLEHCRFPVRDLRAHYKFAHPHTSPPNNMQMRCPVWHDAKDPARKKKKVGFDEGYFSSAKNRKKLHYRSSWEREIYAILEKMDTVARYEVEPLSIEYWHNGESSNYLPDLKIHFFDGHKEIWEIKPSAQSGLAINEAKWQACGEFCKKRGWDFKIITEVGIAKLKKNGHL